MLQHPIRRSCLRSAGVFLALSLFVVPGLPAAEGGLRVLSDPSFLPWQGQFMGTSSYVYGVTNEDIENYQSLNRDTRTISSSQWTQSLAFGIMDDLALRVGDSLILQEDDTTPVGAPTQTTYSQGPVDPSVGITWRVLDQDEQDDMGEHFNWDLIAGYSPDLIEDRAASSTEDGTDGRGGQSASVGTAVSWVIPDFTFYSEYLATYLGERDTTNANDTVTDYGAYLQDSFGFNTQTRLGDRFSFNAGLTGYWNGGYSGQNQNTGLGFVVGGGDEIAINAALNFHFIPNVLVASLTYGNNIYSDRSYSYPTHPTDSTTTVNEDANLFGVRLEYVFL
jgi:hypothetical protein